MQLLSDFKQHPSLTLPILELETAFRACQSISSNDKTDSLKIRLKMIEQTLVQNKEHFGTHFSALY